LNLGQQTKLRPLLLQRCTAPGELAKHADGEGEEKGLAAATV